MSESNVSPASSAAASVTQNIEGIVPAASPESVATPAEVKQEIQRIKKLMLSIDGQNIEEELPFEIDPTDTKQVEWFKNKLQLARVAPKRMQEKALAEKGFQNFLDQLRNDPESILSQVGIDPMEFSEKRIERELENMKKSPEQRRLEEIERENQQLRMREEQRQRQLEEQKQQYEAQRELQSLTNELTSAINRHGKLDLSDPYLLSDIAAFWERHERNARPGERFTADQIVDRFYTKDVDRYFKKMPERLSDKDLEMLYDKKNLERLRKDRLANIPNPNVRDSNIAPQSDKPKSNKKVNMRDFLRHFGEKDGIL